MSHLGDQVVSVLLAIIGVAIVAVIVSNQSNTQNVIEAASGAFTNAVRTAVSPVTGNNTLSNISDVQSPVSGFTAGNIFSQFGQ